ncbi:hypothetical protein IWQ60_009617 [Tieghemiomyces parasiticus]|uniref:Uncharacterized protein n=1 Tax=Tieghemiomyces parasiticus TaxID=78921 RepID=A0A9W8DPU8_9FUNG|nr:hypothetical protein IWQ60_009617 [Tieghemiomyces parasiticus]
MPFVEKIRNLREERPLNEQELNLLQEQFFEGKVKPAAKLVPRSAATTFPSQTQDCRTSTSTSPAPAPSAEYVGTNEEPTERHLSLLKAALLASDIPTEQKIFDQAPEATAPQDRPNRPDRDVVTMPIKLTNFAGSIKTQKAAPKKRSLFAQRRVAQQAMGEVGTSLPTADAGRFEAPPARTGQPTHAPLSRYTEVSQSPAAVQAEPISHSSNASRTTSGIDRRQIDIQNNQILAGMSTEEILEAQREIYSMLPADILASLQRKAAPSAEPADALRTAAQDLEGGPPDRTPQPPSTAVATDESVDFITKLKSQYFADLPTEYDKLAWMGVREPAGAAKEAAGLQPVTAEGDDDLIPETLRGSPIATTRFDFRGRIIAADAERPVHQGLHHHANAPAAAGYTLAELLHLARSTFPTQRVIPMRIFGQILARCRQSLFNAELDPTTTSDDYLPETAAEILRYLETADFPLYISQMATETHRTCVITALDVLYVALVPPQLGDLCITSTLTVPTSVAADERLLSKSGYAQYIKYGLLDRAAALLDTKHRVDLPPLSQHRLLLCVSVALGVTGSDGEQNERTALQSALRSLVRPCQGDEDDLAGHILHLVTRLLAHLDANPGDSSH